MTAISRDWIAEEYFSNKSTPNQDQSGFCIPSLHKFIYLQNNYIGG